MKKILTLLGMFFIYTSVAFAVDPYYALTKSSTTGKSLETISGEIRIAASSATASTPTITLIGSGGVISGQSFCLAGVCIPNWLTVSPSTRTVTTTEDGIPNRLLMFAGTDTVKNSAYDEDFLTALDASTSTTAGDLATLTADVADVIVSTGNLKAQADALASSTGTLRTDLTAESNTRSAADNALAVSTAAHGILLSGLQGEATNYFRRDGTLNTTAPVTFASSATFRQGTLGLGFAPNIASISESAGTGLVISNSVTGPITLNAGSGPSELVISTNGYSAFGASPTPINGTVLSVFGKLYSSGDFALGGNLTTPLTAPSSVTFQNSGFSVGGSTLVIQNGQVGIGVVAGGAYKLQVGGESFFQGKILTDSLGSASGGATGITITGLIKISTLTAISGFPGVAVSTPLIVTTGLGNGFQMKTPGGVSTLRLYQETSAGYGELFVETGGSPSGRISGGVDSYIARYATKFGVGTTAPTEKLDVVGNIKASYGLIATTTTLNGVPYIWPSAAGAPDTVLSIRDDGTTLYWQSISAPTGSYAPTGTLIDYSSNTCPAGYIASDGADISTTTYSDLFALYGHTYDTYTSSAVFKTPDFRGQFTRGWDNGAGVDSGRVFGSTQTDSVKDHTHGITRVSLGAIDAYASNDYTARPPLNTDGVASYTTGETRPKNIAVLKCVKY